MKKIWAVLVVICCLLCCGCSGEVADIYGSISPPKPSGELYHIQKALEVYVNGKIQLVYPSSGDYRSAIITKDITGDGKYEAFAFYSTKTDDKSTVMHINYIMQSEGKWNSVADIQVTASGVESVEFVKLDNGATPKLIVNWNRFSSLEKQLSVYSIDTGVLTEVASIPQSVYSTCDFDGDGIYEVIAVYMDVNTSVAGATYMALTERGFDEKGRCAADPYITAYRTPKITKLTDGTQALFIDAEKASGMVTEVFYIKNGTIRSAFDNTAGNENLKTLRASKAISQDINGDGCLDIPTTTRLPSVPGEEQADSVYMTTYNSFDGEVLTPLSYAVINYSDGYNMFIPESWVNNFTVIRNVQYRERIMYRWDPEDSSLGEEIMRLEVVTLNDWSTKAEHYSQYHEILRSGEDIFAVKFSNSALTPDLDTVKKNFTIIGDGAADHGLSR